MKELIVKPSFSSKITVNNEYLEKQLIELSIKGGYHYELFEYALNQYRLRPWLYDIYGENLLLLKVLRWVLESKRITISDFIFTLREAGGPYRLHRVSWIMFPETLANIFDGVYDKMSYDGYFRENNLNEHIIAMGFKKLIVYIMFSIWNGKPIQKKEIRTWINDITSLINYLLVKDKKEEGLKYWEENTINQLNQLSYNGVI